MTFEVLIKSQFLSELNYFWQLAANSLRCISEVDFGLDPNPTFILIRIRINFILNFIGKFFFEKPLIRL